MFSCERIILVDIVIDTRATYAAKNLVLDLHEWFAAFSGT